MVMPRWPAMKTSWRKKASKSCGRTYEEGQKEKTTHETTRSHTCAMRSSLPRSRMFQWPL